MNEIYQEDYYYVPDLADLTQLTVKQVRILLADDEDHFPNRYKETPAQTAKLRIPKRDVLAFMRKATGNRDLSDESLIELWQAPFYRMDEVEAITGLNSGQIRRLIKFNDDTRKPDEGSSFPQTFKETMGVTSRLRIIKSDVDIFVASLFETA